MRILSVSGYFCHTFLSLLLDKTPGVIIFHTLIDQKKLQIHRYV